MLGKIEESGKKRSEQMDQWGLGVAWTILGKNMNYWL